MNVLILGGGGREHTFCWKLGQSPLCTEIFVAPGNAGTQQKATNLPIDPMNFEAVRQAILTHNIGMLVVGPEAPLVAGIHDFIKADKALEGVLVIGPEKLAATLEGSKEFAKEFMQRHQIPTAKYASFTAATLEDGKTFLAAMSAPYVLKADGLAAGKGVLIIEDLSEAQAELEIMLVNEKFGTASQTVVIEEFLSGIELSAFVLTDGKAAVNLPMAKDYKRIGEGDTGLNTGGMGAVSPVPFVTPEFEKKIQDRIITPTLEGLQKDKIPFQGFIFIGLIKVGEDPFVIEYNVRMGDPETEVVLPRIESDLMELLLATGKQTLQSQHLSFDEQVATTVMAVSGGYPEAYEKGKEITGLEAIENSLLFHAGTQQEGSRVVTSGGRVLSSTGKGSTMESALAKSYATLSKLDFEGMNYRKDIGFDL
jgi:phosphoribosylamine--glycine ligase